MSRPWMPFYVADYLADTSHLSGAEHGAYLLLIMHYWQKGGLPNEDRKLASIARATLEQWSDMRATIAEFFGDGWRHARIEEELAEAEKKYQKRANAGRAGGIAKSERTSNATAMPEQRASNALPTTTTTTIEEKGTPNGVHKKRGERIPDDFEPDKAWAVAQGLSRSEADFEAAQFLDYWRQQAGHRGVKLDWNLTWHVWVRNAIKKRPSRSTGPPPKPRNAGELALMRLNGTYPHEPPDKTFGRLDSGDGRRQVEDLGDVLRPAFGAKHVS